MQPRVGDRYIYTRDDGAHVDWIEIIEIIDEAVIINLPEKQVNRNPVSFSHTSFRRSVLEAEYYKLDEVTLVKRILSHYE